MGETKRNDKINFCVKESLFLFTAGGVTICLPHDRISHHFSVEILWRNRSPEWKEVILTVLISGQCTAVKLCNRMRKTWEQCSKFTGFKRAGDINCQLILIFMSSKRCFSITFDFMVITDNVWLSSASFEVISPQDYSELRSSVEITKPNGRSSSSTQLVVKPWGSSWQEVAYAKFIWLQKVIR